MRATGTRKTHAGSNTRYLLVAFLSVSGSASRCAASGWLGAPPPCCNAYTVLTDQAMFYCCADTTPPNCCGQDDECWPIVPRPVSLTANGCANGACAAPTAGDAYPEQPVEIPCGTVAVYQVAYLYLFDNRETECGQDHCPSNVSTGSYDSFSHDYEVIAACPYEN